MEKGGAEEVRGDLPRLAESDLAKAARIFNAKK